jgi:hypothetical protein
MIGDARADGCDTLPRTSIVLTPIYPNPSVDTSYDFVALKKSAHETGALHDQVNQPLGLTTAQRIGEATTLIQFSVAQPRSAGQVVCGVAQEIRVRFGFENVTIRIAREVAENRCLYDQVLQHEGRHIRVDREVIAEFAPRIEAELRALAAKMGVVRGHSTEAVRIDIERRVRIVAEAQLRAMERENNKRQSVVDRPEEYRRVSSVCGGAAARLIAASRRAAEE